MKKLLFTFFALTSLNASAQLFDNDELYRDERPLHIESYETDDNGTHKMPKKLGSLSSASIKSKGNPKIPILLVQFPDRPFYASGKTPEEVRATYDLYFNGWHDIEKVQTVTKSYGSVVKYFADMSKDQLMIDFTIIGPVTLDNSYKIYGADSQYSRDINIGQFTKEAVTKAVTDFNINWSYFDNNENGDVDFIFFVYAGWGQNASSVRDSITGKRIYFDTDAIWPKEMTAGMSVTTDDGQLVKFACCGMTCESRVTNRNQILVDAQGEFPTGYNPDNMSLDGIGVCVHEVSHALGLPDFYDTVGYNFGMDIWSIMDYGEYGSNGYCPAGYNAYERNFMEWEDLPVLTDPQVVTIPCFEDGGHGYKIVNPANADEYYVLENRQQKGWDRGICRLGHGLQVTHVDYSQSMWLNNYVNVYSDHQRMTIIAANNLYDGSMTAVTDADYANCLAGNLYPGNTFNYNLTDETTPPASVFTGDFMGQPIRNITENEDGTITLCFRTNGKLETPLVSDATDVSDTGFMANWYTCENATRYVVELQGENEYARRDTINDASADRYAFEGLRSQVEYKYRVKALADSEEDYIQSDWSDYVYVNTDLDAIETMFDADQMVKVYAMNGILIDECAASDLHRLYVNPGVYVVKYANGQTKKVLFK